MRLKNVLIVVNDMERSIRFYKELFGLQVILDQDGNVIMTEGLVLQDAKIWKNFIQKELIPKNNMTELYFEESDIEGFAKKLEASEFEIEYVNELMEHSWGQKVIRFYQPMSWLPHVTLGKTLGKEQMRTAFCVLQESFLPFEGQITQLGLAKVNPHEDVVRLLLGREK